MKKCTKCKTTKPLDEFNKHKASPDGHRVVCRPCQSENYAKYYLSDKEYHAKRVREWEKKNSHYDVVKKSRQNIWAMLKWKPDHKNIAVFQESIGCSVEFLKSYLEAQFKPGMTWGNHGKEWTVDHIKPFCLFNYTNPEQLKIANHYTNLQPLWKWENLKKHTKFAA